MKTLLERAWDPTLPFVALPVCSRPIQSAINQWDWSFHTARGGVDPGDRRGRSRVVGAAERFWGCRDSGDF